MKRLPAAIVSLASVMLVSIGFLIGHTTSAQAAPAQATVVAEPTNWMICYLNADRYVLQPVATLPSVTPTRIILPTPTNLPVASATPTAAPCAAYSVKSDGLRVRSGPSLSAAIVRTLTKGTVVSVSTRAGDTVNDTVNGILWRKLCLSSEYLSNAYIQIVP